MASIEQPKDTEKRKVWDKLYREKNKEQINEYAKRYYHENKDKISEKIQCECGGVYRRDSKSRHLKTKMHTNFINGIESKPVAEKYCICERCNMTVNKQSEGMPRHMKRWTCVKAGMEGNPGRKEFYEWILNNKDNLLKDYEIHIKDAEEYFEKRKEIEINVARQQFINDLIDNSGGELEYEGIVDPEECDFPSDKLKPITGKELTVEYHVFNMKSTGIPILHRWRLNEA